MYNSFACPAPIQLASDDASQVTRWYVAYTYPRHERAVADKLGYKSVETFLPTCTETKQWKDRQVRLQVPLFPGYVFTRIAARERLKVLSEPSVIRMLSYRGTLAAVSDHEIDTIRLCLQEKVNLSPHRFLAVGDLVTVRQGVFQGVQGMVVRYNNGCKLVISIGLIEQSVSMEIDPQLLESVEPPFNPGPYRGPCGLEAVVC